VSGQCHAAFPWLGGGGVEGGRTGWLHTYRQKVLCKHPSHVACAAAGMCRRRQYVRGEGGGREGRSKGLSGFTPDLHEALDLLKEVATLIEGGGYTYTLMWLVRWLACADSMC
jgi:hypothetical protein